MPDFNHHPADRFLISISFFLQLLASINLSKPLRLNWTARPTNGAHSHDDAQHDDPHHERLPLEAPDVVEDALEHRDELVAAGYAVTQKVLDLQRRGPELLRANLTRISLI
jgi:hypothetical protein